MGSHREQLEARLRAIDAETALIQARLASLTEERAEIAALLRLPNSQKNRNRSNVKGRSMRAAVLAVFADGGVHSLSAAMMAAGYTSATGSGFSAIVPHLERVSRGMYRLKEASRG